MLNIENIKEYIKDLKLKIITIVFVCFYLIPLTLINYNYSIDVFKVCTFLKNYQTDQNIKLTMLASAQTFPKNSIIRDLAASQAILESNLLKNPSILASKYNNAFGITGKGTKGSVYLITKEYIKGKWITTKRAFAWNMCLDDSFDQYKKIIHSLSRYVNVYNAKTFEEAARAVQKGGWATDPYYSTQLIHIYNKYLKGKYKTIND